MSDEVEKLKAKIEALQDKNISLEDQLKSVTIKGATESSNQPQEPEVLHDDEKESMRDMVWQKRWDNTNIREELSTNQEV